MSERPIDISRRKQLASHAESGHFDVFLSHNSQDKPAVIQLGIELQQRGLKPWLDVWELRPGLGWQDSLEKIVKTCGAAAFCVAGNGVGPWEDPEMKALLRRFINEKKVGNILPVIPVLLPGASADIKLPLFLEEFTWVDLRDGLTEEGIDRLMWGITGMKPAPPAPTAKPLSSESLDKVLLAYSDVRLAEWNQAWTNPDDPDRLFYYVPPHYALVNPETPDVKRSDLRFPQQARLSPESETLAADESCLQRVPGGTEEETLDYLLQSSDRLCLSEGPGAGKSIFTRRVQAFLSSPAGRQSLFEGKPALAVRWEEWDGRWPDDFHASLARELESCCEDAVTRSQSPALAEAALAAGRVVLILDALDQVGTEERIRHLSDFLAESRRRAWRLRVVMTGRPFAVEQRKSTLLRDPTWRFACIEDFDAEQQFRYLYGPEISPQKAVSKSEAWSIRSLPSEKIRRLVAPAQLSGDGAKKQIEASLSKLFPNYEQVSLLIGNPAVLAMVRGLAEENELADFKRRGDLYSQTSFLMLKRAAQRLGEPADATSIESTEAVLAAVACQMMVHDPNTYRLDGERSVARLREQAARRVAGCVAGDEWRRIEAITGLTNRSLLYGASHDVLAWHHKGMMEFYCGLHLAKNSQSGWCQEETDSQGQRWPTCGDADVRRAAADPQWYWAFRFAMEMNADLREPKALLASLSTLFQPVPGATEHSRPTELMQRAWSLLAELPPHEWFDTTKPTLLPQGERVIERFHSQFEAILADPRHPQHTTAQVLTHAFVPCPPDGFSNDGGGGKDLYKFVMGANDSESKNDREKPQHPARLAPFHLMTTQVTRRQYALFDPNHERKHRDDPKYSPEEDCPVNHVNWYDAWCFARWLGADYHLPTEAEWECACRAGKLGKWCCGDDEENLSEYAWYGEGYGEGSTHRVAEKQANAWGLYDMHGNVWEWCQDWFDEQYYTNSPEVDPRGPELGVFRVNRGGSWTFRPRYCRSAYRGWFVPQNRIGDLGFRVARSPSGKYNPAGEREGA